MVIRKKSVDDRFVVVGRVRRAWGVKGQLSVDWYDGSCPVKIGCDNIFLESKGAGTLSGFVISGDRPHGDHSVITLEGLSAPEEALEFRGSEIWVEKDKLPGLKNNEFYTYQLIEMRVETADGEYLGEIAEIISTGSNDVYVVRNGEREIMIPAVDDVVKKVDVAAKIMVVELIEGLI